MGVARSDNNTDMRYLINMDYSFDLNINTMGRRIRTRLYFSSESHLHTILNVLRFTKCDDGRSLLSKEGLAKLNGTPEICYLTQFVMRVFEDRGRDMNDPKRFRVEMLFSPGATATPFHMNEMDREADASRFDTAPLENIGRDDLTCQDVEDFFEQAIMAGRSDDGDLQSQGSIASEQMRSPAMNEVLDTPASSPIKSSKKQLLTPVIIEEAMEESDHDDIALSGITVPTEIISRTASPLKLIETGLDTSRDLQKDTSLDARSDEPESAERNEPNPSRESEKKEEGTADDSSKSTRRSYFWSVVAVGCFTLGLACLGTALHMSYGTRRRRQWISKR